MDVVFEVSDHRELPRAQLLHHFGPLALLEPTPGSVHVWFVTGKSLSFSLQDDHYDWDEKGLTLYTDTGMIVFVPVTEHSDILNFVNIPLDAVVQTCLQA